MRKKQTNKKKNIYIYIYIYTTRSEKDIENIINDNNYLLKCSLLMI